MDRLSPLFAHFSLTARVFYSGNPCGTFNFSEPAAHGYLHILRRGNVSLTHANANAVAVNEPSIIFYPRAHPHRFTVEADGTTELICTTIDFGAGLGNPLMQALPDVLIIPLNSMVELTPMLTLFFDEVFNPRCGRQAAVDRLAEYFLVLLLRHTIETQMVTGGLLAGLADARLVKAINAMHEHPEHPWSLADLARTADMSRARFAVHFRHTLGVTPLAYLTDWRISVTQTLLKRGKPLKLIAPAVGYSHPVALARVFLQRVGSSPKAWLAQLKSDPPTN